MNNHFKQKCGPLGNINKTGKPGEPSFLFPSTNLNFTLNVERGIRATVKAAVKCGFDTFSSCEGHVKGAQCWSSRCLCFIIEQAAFADWVLLIATMNRLYGINFYLSCPDERDSHMVFTRQYKQPLVINITIGSPNDHDIEYKTVLLTNIFKKLHKKRKNFEKKKSSTEYPVLP
ncbi:MAG: hypothetical protein WCI27_00575 [Candidatus Omnitrophota bacterium]